MEESATRHPKPNEFVIPENEAYAMTDIRTWKIAEFLMTELEPVDLETLDPDDRECAICQQEFRVSEDVKLSHAPVKTVCGHIFGKPCIIKWLDPLCFWGLTEGAEPEVLDMGADFEDGKTSCPTCRTEFFSETTLEPMEALSARLWMWDAFYTAAGIALSEKEERSRRALWTYVDYCRSINEFKISRNTEFSLLARAQRLVVEFTERLQAQALTPVQKSLTISLKRLGKHSLRDVMLKLCNWGESDSESELESADATVISSHEESGEEQEEEGEHEEEEEEEQDEVEEEDEDEEVEEDG